MVVAAITGLFLLGLIVWFFEVVLSQRRYDVDVTEVVG